MKLLQVSCTDLPASFSGYGLSKALEDMEVDTKQIVLEKYSADDEQIVLSVEKDNVLHQICRWAEDRYSVSNLLYPYGKSFLNSRDFMEADVVHFQILHRFMFSLFDYPALMNTKKAVWTIHDPWILSGNCVHPLECEKWKTGCGNCGRLQESGFEMRSDNTGLMWEIKHTVMKQINPNIVVASKFMEDYLRNSPITNHFNKIHRIPFGVKIENYNLENRNAVRQRYGILKDEIVVGFRADNNPIKGGAYIVDALDALEERDNVVIATVGGGKVSEKLKECYKTLELGWINGEKNVAEYMLLCDIFLMPSLAESFGYMALEAMAAATPVVCFEGTVVAELVDAPKCGLAVQYKSVKGLKDAISYMLKDKDARIRKGRAGRERVCQEYLFKEYVHRHRNLYFNILKEDA